MKITKMIYRPFGGIDVEYLDDSGTKQKKHFESGTSEKAIKEALAGKTKGSTKK